MKCNQCGTEFEGKFCPECGAKGETETPIMFPSVQQQTQQQVDQQPASATATKPVKKKKPFFLRWWFILLAVVVVGVVVLSVGGNGEKIVWDDMVLGDMIPEPPANKGKIYDNSAEELWITINNVSDKEFANYVDECKEKGFAVDADSDSHTYDAYNAEGYKLSLSHYGSDADMTVRLESPMEMTTIQWPTSIAGQQLPTPKSTTGKFSYEYDDSFFVYVGGTTKADYDEYVKACSEKGFNVDYEKGEHYYYADNSEGWRISLCYEGNNIMSIDVDAPRKDDDGNNTPVPSPEESAPDTTDKKPESSDAATDEGVLDPEFKAAMDSYEKFMDEYVAFMKKYSANPSDISLLTDYADYMSKYADFVENFEKWEDEEMNAAETAYYIDVQARVNKKLLEVAQ